MAEEKGLARWFIAMMELMAVIWVHGAVAFVGDLKAVLKKEGAGLREKNCRNLLCHQRRQCQIQCGHRCRCGLRSRFRER